MGCHHYLLSPAIWIPASGWIGDRVGTKKAFLFALIVFTTSSALCGVAWNIQSLIACAHVSGAVFEMSLIEEMNRRGVCQYSDDRSCHRISRCGAASVPMHVARVPSS